MSYGDSLPKARSPTVMWLVGWTCSSSVEAEWSQRQKSMSATWHSSWARLAPCRRRQQRTSTASLNSIRCGTRCQWRSWSSVAVLNIRAEQRHSSWTVQASHPHWTSTTIPVRLCIHSFCTQWQILSEAPLKLRPYGAIQICLLLLLLLYRLRSTGSADYVLPRTRTRFGERGFFYCGPAAWNTLLTSTTLLTPVHSENGSSILFDRTYHWLLLALPDVPYSGPPEISHHWLIDWLIDRLVGVVLDDCSSSMCDMCVCRCCRCDWCAPWLRQRESVEWSGREQQWCWLHSADISTRHLPLTSSPLCCCSAAFQSSLLGFTPHILLVIISSTAYHVIFTYVIVQLAFM